MMNRGIALLVRIYDRCDSHDARKLLEGAIVRLAAVGFLVHLALIAATRIFPSLGGGLLSGLDRNFLHAVYTPFSFILFYEVLLLIFAIPTSHTSAIGKQYEIISLVVIRGVFKDIGEFRDPTTWLAQYDEAISVLMDMAAAVLMFLLVTVFYRIRQTVVKSQAGDKLNRFVTIKKSVAVVLCVVLLGLASFNLLHWMLGVFLADANSPASMMDLDSFFFPEFFELVIFADVLLLILSLPFYERYEYVIRNAGFVISTVLLRFSLTTPKPFDLLVGLIAMIYGLCVLSVFSYYTRISASASSGGPTAGVQSELEGSNAEQ
jgi:hypothetical protein